MSKIDVRTYIENLLNKNFKLRKYKKIEELTVLEIDKSGAYPVAICKNQNGKTVKIGVTFLKLYYTQTKDDSFVLENREHFRAIQAHENMSFIGSSGETFNLKAEDYIVIDSKNRIFGETKADFEESYVPVRKYSKVQAQLKEM